MGTGENYINHKHQSGDNNNCVKRDNDKRHPTQA